MARPYLRLERLRVDRMLRRGQRDGVRARLHVERRGRLAALGRAPVDRDRGAGGRRGDGHRARATAQRLELLRRLVALLGRERRRREVALEHLGGLLGLVEPHVALGDVPELERRAAEAVRLLEVADRVVVAAVGVGLRALLVEDAGAREVLGRARRSSTAAAPSAGATAGASARRRAQRAHDARSARKRQGAQRGGAQRAAIIARTPLTTRSMRA